MDRCENYRPISLLNSLYKLYTSMLLARFQEALGDRISRWQCGFRRGYSVDDAVFSLLRVIELCENLSDLPGFMLLLDWKQAYDRVHTRPQAIGCVQCTAAVGGVFRCVPATSRACLHSQVHVEGHTRRGVCCCR